VLRVSFSFDVSRYAYTANVAADNARYARLVPITLNLVDLANRMENGVVGRSIIGCCVREASASVWHFSDQTGYPFLFRVATFSREKRRVNGIDNKGDDDGKIAR